MSIVENGDSAKPAMSPQLPLQIPSGVVHVYFVQPSKQDKTGVERTTLYYTVGSTKFKFMAKNPEVRRDLIALGTRADLAEVDEEFNWAKGGKLTIRILPRA